MVDGPRIGGFGYLCQLQAQFQRFVILDHLKREPKRKAACKVIPLFSVEHSGAARPPPRKMKRPSPIRKKGKGQKVGKAAKLLLRGRQFAVEVVTTLNQHESEERLRFKA